MKNKRTLLVICGVIVLLLGLGVGFYFIYKNYSGTQRSKESFTQNNQDKSSTTPEAPPAYTLVGYTGEVFGAKVPKGWNVTANESGIDIVDNTDSSTGATGAVAVGWFGSQTPDGFIDFMLNAIGAQNVAYENSSDQAEITDSSSNLKWQMKTKIFTFLL